MINTELLQLTLKTIKENPEHWDQTRWHCGTSHCFAGFAQLIYNNISIKTDESILVEEYNFGENVYDSFNGKSLWWHTEEYSKNILGITEDDATVLFSSSNDLEQLELYVDTLIKEGSLSDYYEYIFC